jgi:Ca-activated chloride channel family protein
MTKLSVQLDRGSVPAGGGTVRAAVRIQPGMTDENARRHVAMCIDTSGSMSGEKIEQVREGVRWTFGYLSDSDYLSIVTFDDEVEVVLPATRWGDMTLDEADAIVEEMRPGGGTDILGGLEAAYGTLEDLSAGPDVGRRILLLSDGRDETETPTFAEFARRVRREDGIAVPAAGIGEFYDEATIRTVGTASDGEWVHLSRAGDIENFFGRKVETLGTVVAPSPNLEVGLPAGARVGEVLLRQPQVRAANVERVDDGVRVFLPDLLEFETQEVVFTVEAPPCEGGRSFRFADVTLNTPGETTTAAVDVECVAETGTGATEEVETPEVTVKHVETKVRKAASEGDLERAETMLAQATGEADVPDETTEIRRDVGDEGARTRDETDPDDDETWTVVGDDVQVRQDQPETEATKIQQDQPETEATKIQQDQPETEATKIQQEAVADLSGVVDEEGLAELRTVVESTAADDLEDQYRTTKIRDEEGG